MGQSFTNNMQDCAVTKVNKLLMNRHLLQETLSVIALERSRSFDTSFDLVDDLLVAYGHRGLIEHLYADIPKDYPWEVIADLFVLLMWAMGDQGAALATLTECWLLQANNLKKIQIALNLEVYPFDDAEQMQHVLAVVAYRYPEVAPRCQELIASRLRSPREFRLWHRMKQWLRIRLIVWTSFARGNAPAV
jgi:hypothetical protein